jgi:hypothetical protein
MQIFARASGAGAGGPIVTGTSIQLVEFGSGGHRGDYIRHLADGWRKARLPGGTLRITVTPEFARFHRDTLRSIGDRGADELVLGVMPDDAAEALRRAERVVRAPSSWLFGAGPPDDSLSALQWDTAQACARAGPTDHLLLMELDTVLPAVAAHRHSICPVSGLWFKPAFRDACGALPPWARHQKVMLARALSHPQLHCIFCLDPDVPGLIPPRSGGTRMRYLPDPVVVSRDVDRASRERQRERLGIAPDRVVLLFFGQLARRKGLVEILAAAGMLSSGHRQRLALIIAGACDDIRLDDVSSALDGLRRSGVQALLREGFLAEAESEELFAASDAVLVPYLRHVGMSGVLLRAAAHGLPVLSQDYGLMGRLVGRHRLGLIADTRDAQSLVDALTVLVDGTVGDRFDPASALKFASSHDPSTFCRVLFDGLGVGEAQ